MCIFKGWWSAIVFLLILWYYYVLMLTVRLLDYLEIILKECIKTCFLYDSNRINAFLVIIFLIYNNIWWNEHSDSDSDGDKGRIPKLRFKIQNFNIAILIKFYLYVILPFDICPFETVSIINYLILINYRLLFFIHLEWLHLVDFECRNTSSHTWK